MTRTHRVPRPIWTVATAILLALAIVGVHQTFFVPPCGRIIHAAAECPVGSTDVFSNNIGLQSGGTFTGTIDLATNPTADFTLSVNHGNAGDTIPVVGQTQTWTADQTYNDSVNLTLGTGGDADIFYDGTDLTIDPAVVGSGAVILSGNLYLSSSDASLGRSGAATIDFRDRTAASTADPTLKLTRTSGGSGVQTMSIDSGSLSVGGGFDMSLSSGGGNLLTIGTTSVDLNTSTLTDIGEAAIGTTTFPSSGDSGLVFGDGTALSGMASNTAGIYADDVSGTVEVFVIDEAGNASQISPHPSDFLNTLALSCDLPWAFQSSNAYVGKKVSVDLCGAIQAIEALTGQTFITVTDLAQSERRDWGDDQQEHFDKCIENGGVAGVDCVKEEPPQWMKDRGVGALE